MFIDNLSLGIGALQRGAKMSQGLSDVDRETLAKMLDAMFEILRNQDPGLKAHMRRIVREMDLEMKDVFREHQETASQYRIK